MTEDPEEHDETAERDGEQAAAELRTFAATQDPGANGAAVASPGGAELVIRPDVLHLAIRTLVLPPAKPKARSPKAIFQFDPGACSIIIRKKDRMFWLRLPIAHTPGAGVESCAFEVDYAFLSGVATHLRSHSSDLRLLFDRSGAMVELTADDFELRYTATEIATVNLPIPESRVGHTQPAPISYPPKLAQALRAAGTFSSSKTKPAVPKSLADRLSAYRDGSTFDIHDAYIEVGNGIAVGGTEAGACRASLPDRELTISLCKPDLALVCRTLRRMGPKGVWFELADQQVFSDGVLNAAVPRARIPARLIPDLWEAPANFVGIIDRQQLLRELGSVGILMMQARKNERPVFSLTLEQGVARADLRTDASFGHAILPIARRDLEPEEAPLPEPVTIWTDFRNFEKAASVVGGENLLLEILTKTAQDVAEPRLLRISRMGGDYNCQAFLPIERRRQ